MYSVCTLLKVTIHDGHLHPLSPLLGHPYLWILGEGLLVVDTPSCSPWGLPGSVSQPLVPGLIQRKHGCVHHSTDGCLLEVLAVVIKGHPLLKERIFYTLFPKRICLNL